MKGTYVVWARGLDSVWETTHQRKLDHINLVLEWRAEHRDCVWDKYQLPYQALVEEDLESVDTSCEFFGSRLSFPFLISSMTWWPEKWYEINRNLAQAAEHCKVALALGSMRICIEDPATFATFDVKKYCPSVPIFANLGMIQLNYGFGADEIMRLVDTTGANGIFLHLNALQEAVQPEGNVNFHGLLRRLSQIISRIQVPVLVKECGNGIDAWSAQKLVEIGIQWIDVSGRWWTSRPKVESLRRSDDLGEPIQTIGIPADEAILECRSIPWIKIIAWWWVRSGIDLLKTRTLGASMGTAAAPFLGPALQSTESVISLLDIRKRQYQIGLRSMGRKAQELG